MISFIIILLLFMYNTNDVAAFLRLTCFEVFVIHTCVDVWTFRGKDISDYIEEQLEPRPEVKLLKLSDSPHETKENKKPMKLDEMIVENYFT